VGLLADSPGLIPAVGEIRCQEWGRAQEPEQLSWWVDVTARETGRDELPVTFVAVDPLGAAAGQSTFIAAAAGNWMTASAGHRASLSQC